MGASVTERLLSEWESFRQLDARFNNSVDERIRDLETIAARPIAGGAGGRVDSDRRALYAAWQSEITSRNIDPAQIDSELVERYRVAFLDYVRRGERANHEHLAILNEMSVGSDADGGFWVDPDTSGRVGQLLRQRSPIRQLASVQEIGSDALEGPIDVHDAGSGWVGEHEARPDTDNPQVGLWRIPAHELYAMPKLSQKLLDDMRVDAGEWIARKVADRFAREEGAAFVAGSGVDRPRGFLTYPAGTPSQSTWAVIRQLPSGSASTITADALIDVVYSLKPWDRANAAWGMNASTIAIVRKLKDLEDRFIWTDSIADGQPPMLLGYPVHELPDMPDVAGAALPVVFANFAEAYQVVDRFGLRILRDPFTTKGFVKFYSTKRAGGGVVNFDAITLMKVASS